MGNDDVGFTVVRGGVGYDAIPILVPEIPGFVGSQEWQDLADNDLFDLPGVVLGALRRFLERLLSSADAGDAAQKASIQAGFELIEQLVSQKDHSLREAVVYELFEPLETGTVATSRFCAALGVRSKELLRESGFEIDPMV